VAVDDPDRYATAYHEAGHAVIGTLIGRTLISLTTNPTRKSAGRCIFNDDDKLATLYDYRTPIDWLREKLVWHLYEPEVLMASRKFWRVVNAKGVALVDRLPHLRSEIDAARQRCACLAIALMAGPRAEERFTGKFNQQGAAQDLETICAQLAIFFCEYDDDEEAAREAAVALYDGPTIEEYLDDPLVWSWITAVAQTAYYAGDMTGDEVRALRPAELT